MLRVLVCGSRHWTSRDMIASAMLAVEESRGDYHLITGSAEGADILAEDVARCMGLIYTGVPADWKRLGRSAGPRRNEKMLAVGKPDIVVAFTRNLEESRGTRHMVGLARSAGVPTYVIGGMSDLAGFREWLSPRDSS